MLNQYMNKAMSIISTMTIEEKMLYISLTFEETVMDKDYLMGEDIDEVPCVVTYNSGIQKFKKFNPKHTLRDKSKAGYHNGARNQGFVPYERFGLKERLNKDRIRDEDSQIREFYNPTEEIMVDEAVKKLWKVYSFHFKYFDTVLVPIMPYSYYDDDDLYKNIEFVKEKHEECKGVLEDIQSALYEFVGELAGSQGISWEKEVVNAFNDKVLDYLETRKNSVIQYLVGVYKDYVDHQIFKEGIRHVDEMGRLNHLKKKVENYLK